MFMKTKKFSQMTAMMFGSACVALVACGSPQEGKSPVTSAQQVCQDAQDTCQADIDAAIAKLKLSQEGCAKTLETVCTAKGSAVDADACEAAVRACDSDLKSIADQQATLGENCSDKVAESCQAEDLPTAPPATNAACDAAQATCQAAVEGLGAKQEGFQVICGSSLQEACSTGKAEECDEAQAACEKAVAATQDEAEKLHEICAESVKNACMDMKAGTAPTPPTPSVPAPNAGAPDTSKCEAALSACESVVKGDNGEANKACQSALDSGCGPAGSAESCKAAHESCKAAHESAQAAFAAGAGQCQKSVEDACK